MAVKRSEYLKNATVWRGGISQDTVTKAGSSVKCISNGERWHDYPSNCIKISTSISSKGGGFTAIVLRIDQTDFEDVILAMLQADRQATLRAMSATLLAAAEA